MLSGMCYRCVGYVLSCVLDLCWMCSGCVLDVRNACLDACDVGVSGRY